MGLKALTKYLTGTKEKTYIQRRPWEDGDNDWKDTTPSQGKSGATKS